MPATPPVVWRPHPGSQALFLTCPHFECLYEGTRGPGKSTALLMAFAQHVGRFGADWRGVVFRRTYKQLDDLVLKAQIFHKIFPEARFNKADYVWSWPGGEELLFRYMYDERDYWNYHGHEYAFIGFDELTNWPTLKPYHLLKSCSRSTREGMPRWIRATANPYGVGHNVVKSYFVDPQPRSGVPFSPPTAELPDELEELVAAADLKAVRLTGRYEENLSLMRADPGYPAKIAAAAPNPEAAKAWIRGDWDIVSGGVIDDLWRREVHVVEPFEIPAGWRIDRSLDWGSSKPFSVGWWAESDGSPATLKDGSERYYPRGTVFRIGEWYGWNGRPNEGLRMVATEVARGILERERAVKWGGRVRVGPADPSIHARPGTGHSIAEDMELAGVSWEKGVNDRKSGVEALRSRLKAALPDGEGRPSADDPALYVFSTCAAWLRTVPVLPRSEKNPDDADTDAEDHAYDETRYRIMRGRTMMDLIGELARG